MSSLIFVISLSFSWRFWLWFTWIRSKQIYINSDEKKTSLEHSVEQEDCKDASFCSVPCRPSLLILSALCGGKRETRLDRPSSCPAWICIDLGFVCKFGIAENYLVPLPSFICMSPLSVLSQSWILSMEQYGRSTGITWCNLCPWG